MKYLKGLFVNAWKIYFFLVVLLSLILLYPLYFILLRKEAYFGAGFRLIRVHARFILIMIGVIPKRIGTPPPNNQSYIYCPNHSSYLDILLLYACMPNYFVFLGKKELGEVPVFNIFFKRMNILIDRSNPKASHNSIMRVLKLMGKGGSVVIFPEGTIPISAPEMKAFKNGAFRVALECKAPIVPISFPNNANLLEDSWSFFAKAGPGRARMLIHDAINLDELGEQDLISLREKTREIIQSGL